MNLEEAQEMYREQLKQLNEGKERLEELEGRRDELMGLKGTVDVQVEAVQKSIESATKSWVAGVAKQEDVFALRRKLRELEDEQSDLGLLLTAIEEEVKAAFVVKTIGARAQLDSAETAVFRAVAERNAEDIRKNAGHLLVSGCIAYNRTLLRGNASLSTYVERFLGDLLPHDHAEAKEALRAEYLK
jgi:DNA repair exonuclease SbcCD ATPase subunit